MLYYEFSKESAVLFFVKKPCSLPYRRQMYCVLMMIVTMIVFSSPRSATSTRTGTMYGGDDVGQTVADFHQHIGDSAGESGDVRVGVFAGEIAGQTTKEQLPGFFQIRRSANVG